MALQVFGRNGLVGRAGLEPAMLNDRIYSPARYQLRSTDPCNIRHIFNLNLIKPTGSPQSRVNGKTLEDFQTVLSVDRKPYQCATTPRSYPRAITRSLKDGRF